MKTLACCLASVLFLASAASAQPQRAYLYTPGFDLDGTPAGTPMPYQPQPGDIFLATDNLWFNKIGHWLAGSGAPHHSGLIVPTRNGGLGILEAGPKNTFSVRLTEDFVGHFAYHENKGERVWIRQRAVPLTPEECERLAEWAAAQDGKWFAAFRLVGQLTPFRSRGPWRSRYLGKPHGPQNSYFCSELVMESCVAAGLLDRERTRPRCTYPRDLFFGRCTIQVVDESLAINDSWVPPARLTCMPPAGPPIDLTSHRAAWRAP